MTETEKLTRAVLALEQRFKKAENAKPQGILSQLISGQRQQAKAKLSEVFSARGVAGMLGVSPTSILGQVLETRHEKKEEKRQEATRAREFASGFTKYTEKGRALSAIDQKKALTQGVALYQRNKALTAGIEEIEARKEEAKKLGGGAGITEQEERKLQDLKFQKENLFDEKKRRERTYKAPRVPVPKPVEEPAPVTTARTQPMDQGAPLTTPVPEPVEEPAPLTTPVPEPVEEPAPLTMKESFFQGVAEGASEELLKLNQEQLAVLEKIEANSKVSEEDLLEKKKDAVLTPITQGKEKKEKTGLFDSLFNLTGMFKKLLPGLGSLKNILPAIGRIAALAGPLLAIAGPILAIAGAGVAGFMLGKNVVNPAIDWAAQKLTGDKSDTLGSTISKAFGGLESEKMDMGASYEGKDSVNQGIQLIAEGKPISQLFYDSLKKNKKLMTPEQLSIFENTAPKILGKTSPISKPPETTREAQVSEMDRGTQEATRIAKEKAGATQAAPASTVVSTNQNITNISKTTKISPPVRNSEPSFLDGLNHQFA